MKKKIPFASFAAIGLQQIRMRNMIIDAALFYPKDRVWISEAIIGEFWEWFHDYLRSGS